MVEVALHHPAVAGEVRLREDRIPSQGLGAVAHAVGLDIAFVHHIQAILVAQGDPARVVGIVAGADGVDVQLLHDPDVPDHLGLGDDIAAGRAQLVPVGALDEDGLAVHQQLVAHDLHGPETELEGRVLRHGLIRGRLHAEGIEVRGLGAPEGGIPDRPLIAGRPLDRTDLAGSQDALPGRIQDFHLHEGDTLGHFGLDLQAAVGAGGHVDVLDPLLLAGIDLHAAGDAGEAPEILVLQVGAVAPAEDLQGDEVLPGADIFRQVEAGLELAVLAVAHHLAVHPHADVGGGGTDVQADLLADPGRVHGEGPAVLAHVVVLRGRVRRIVLVVALPGIADVQVHRVAVSVEVPHSRHRDLAPGAVVIIDRLEPLEPAFDGGIEIELPQSVQAQGLLLVGNEGRPHRQAVFFKYVRVLPGFHLGLRREGQEGGQEGQGKEKVSHVVRFIRVKIAFFMDYSLFL